MCLNYFSLFILFLDEEVDPEGEWRARSRQARQRDGMHSFFLDLPLEYGTEISNLSFSQLI
jgi:hypothetical protein